MANGKSRGYIILEVLAVFLVVVLWFILTEPPQIWEQENNNEEKCQQNMSGLYEAENYFYKSNNGYILDFDSLYTFLKNDTSLQNAKLIVEYSKKLNSQVTSLLDVPAINALYKINSAVSEISADFVANQHYFGSVDSSFIETADIISANMQKLYTPISNLDLVKTFVFLDSLTQLTNNIADYPIQIASQKALMYSDSINSGYSNFTTDKLNSVMSPIISSLYDFYRTLKESEIAKKTNAADRLKKFTDQINRANSNYDQFIRNEQESLLQHQFAQLKTLHEDFLKPDKFALTSRFASLALDEVEAIVAVVDESYKICPDCEKPYIYKTTMGGGIVIECPNLQEHASNELLPELAKIKNYPLWSAIDGLVIANDSLISVARDNKNLLRKHRTYFMQYKDIESDFDFINENKLLVVKYLKNINNMMKVMDESFQISSTEQLFSDNLNGFDTLAARCMTHNFVYFDKWAEQLEKKVMKLDSMPAEFKLKRREKANLIDVKGALEYWKTEVEKFKSAFKAGYADELLTTRVILKEKFDALKNGRRERQQVIFYQNHKNHGNVDNGLKSWEK